MTTHLVKQGECLLSIAHLYGFTNWRNIYDHPDNASLRELRPDPHVLCPGDCVVIPERRAKQERITTGKAHTFKVAVPKTFLRLDVLEGLGGAAVQASYELELEGQAEPLRGEIGADGRLDVQIPAKTQHARLTLFTPQTRDILSVLQLELGALDPLSTLSGVRQRLRRLGFSCPEGDGKMEAHTEAAISDFQHRHRLQVDGTPGKQTQDKLLELLGV